MKKNRKRTKNRLGKPLAWLPVDSRLIPPIFAFGKVQGWARVFLEIEIVLALLVVIGTLLLVALSLFA